MFHEFLKEWSPTLGGLLGVIGNGSQPIIYRIGGFVNRAPVNQTIARLPFNRWLQLQIGQRLDTLLSILS